MQPSSADVKDIWKQSQNIKKIESKSDSEFGSQQELPPTTINPTSQQQLGTSGIQEVKIKKETNEVIFGIYDATSCLSIPRSSPTYTLTSLTDYFSMFL